MVKKREHDRCVQPKFLSRDAILGDDIGTETRIKRGQRHTNTWGLRILKQNHFS